MVLPLQDENWHMSIRNAQFSENLHVATIALTMLQGAVLHDLQVSRRADGLRITCTAARGQNKLVRRCVGSRKSGGVHA